MRRELCISRVAEGQNELITAVQLYACGVSSSAISRRVRLGRLHRQHQGVYSVGRADLTEAGRFHAAVLAIGDGAVLGMRAAATLRGFWTGETEPIEVIVPRRVPSRESIRVYGVADLPRADWGWCQGVPTTLPARTCLDLAATVKSDHAFRRALHEAMVKRLVSRRSLQQAIDLHPNHPGAKRLAAEIADGAKPTRSSFEDWCVELLRENDFPHFLTNTHPPGTPKWVEVDVLFPEHGLVIEVDGVRYHNTPYRRKRDARKQGLVEAAGYPVLRLCDEDATPERRAETVTRIANALRDRRAT